MRLRTAIIFILMLFSAPSQALDQRKVRDLEQALPLQTITGPYFGKAAEGSITTGATFLFGSAKIGISLISSNTKIWKTTVCNYIGDKSTDIKMILVGAIPKIDRESDQSCSDHVEIHLSGSQDKIFAKVTINEITIKIPINTDNTWLEAEERSHDSPEIFGINFNKTYTQVMSIFRNEGYIIKEDIVTSVKKEPLFRSINAYKVPSLDEINKACDLNRNSMDYSPDAVVVLFKFSDDMGLETPFMIRRESHPLRFERPQKIDLIRQLQSKYGSPTKTDGNSLIYYFNASGNLYQSTRSKPDQVSDGMAIFNKDGRIAAQISNNNGQCSGSNTTSMFPSLTHMFSCNPRPKTINDDTIRVQRNGENASALIQNPACATSMTISLGGDQYIESFVVQATSRQNYLSVYKNIYGKDLDRMLTAVSAEQQKSRSAPAIKF